MRRGAALALTLLCLLTAGCAGGPKQYEVTYWDLFDTVTVIKGYAGSQEDFTARAQALHDQLWEYHQLYDIYHDYEGVVNLKTVNDAAGTAPVKVDRRIIDLLLVCKALYAGSGGAVNAAMGSVLSLWHEAREAALEDPENAALPDGEALAAAMDHMDFDAVVIDEAASTVFLTDPDQRLDVGAVAKGYAAARVTEEEEALILNLGGNVCAAGPKTGGDPWVVAVPDPSGGEALTNLSLTRGAVVTSGDYQRYFTVEGENYHHIVDPATGWPARYWQEVTVLCADSGTADALSTALFVLDREAGESLLAEYGAQAIWLDREGNLFYSTGFTGAL